MLPRPHRLRIQETRGRRGARVRRGPFTLVRYTPTTPLARCGIVIRGKGAVERNRLRRRISAALYPLLKTLPAEDMVLAASLDASAMSLATLRAALTAFFEQRPTPNIKHPTSQ